MDLEHVQPVQSLTPRGQSRARTLATAMLPVVLLGGVIGFGILGQGQGEPDGPERRADSEESTRPGRSDGPGPSGPAALEGGAAGFPQQALDLPVRSVDETLRLRAGRSIGDEPVAVAGWLTILPDPVCLADGRHSPAVCPRNTVLLAEETPILTYAAGDLRLTRDVDAELHPQAMPGVPLEAVASVQGANGERVFTPVPVVIVGRFEDPRLLAGGFAIERIIWIDGQWRLRRPVRHPAVADHQLSGKVRWPIVNEAIDRGGVILSELVAPREDLARIDPAADRAVDEDVRGAVWYVRAMLRPRSFGDTPREVGWAVIEDATGMVLAAEPARRTAASGSD
jgi:hypothetical protein